MYGSTTQLTMYYYTMAGIRRSAYFAVSVADGARHRVTLMVEQSTAKVSVMSAVDLVWGYIHTHTNHALTK